MSRSADFNTELDRLQEKVTKWLRRKLKHARKPGMVWARIPLAMGLIVGGVLGFLPVLGFWMLPLGFALFAIDLPFLQHPLASLLAAINRKVADA